jgi:hypothetical protein
MRCLFLLTALAGLAACEPDGTIIQAEVLWMEWPADVAANQQFKTRLVVQWGCGAEAFRPGTSVDQSAVTFTPYYHADRSATCPLSDRVLDLDILGSLDTAGLVPGLGATVSRTYEMRAAASVHPPALGLTADGKPIRTFGEIRVLVPAGLFGTNLKVAGRAYAVRDTAGCLRLQPLGVFREQTSWPIENPADTAQYQIRFVRGEIRTVTTPVCGETKVFHIESVN